MLPSLEVKVTADTSAAEAGLKNVKGDIQDVGSVAQRGQRVVRDYGRATEGVGNSSIFASNKTRMLSQQLSQVLQQTTASGNLMQSFAVQAADIGLAFGVVGTAIGAVAGIALPSLMGAMSGGAEGAKELEDAIESLSDTMESSDAIVAVLSGDLEAIKDRYGELTGVVLSLAEAEGDIQLRNMADAAMQLNAELTALYNGNAWLNVSRAEDLHRGLELAGGSARWFASMMESLSQADTLDEQLAIVTAMRERFREVAGEVGQMSQAQLQFFTYLVDSERALIKLKTQVGDIEDATSATEQAAKNMRMAFDASVGTVAALTASTDGLLSSISSAADRALDLANNLLAANTERAKMIADAEARGGGRGDDPRQHGLDPVGIIIAGRGGEITDAYSKLLEEQESYQSSAISSAQDFADTMVDIARQEQMAKLDGFGGMFGDLSALMQTENKKLFNIGKAAAIAEATVNGYKAAVSAWEKGMSIGGPPVAAAFTAASLAKTGALISGIASQSIGGGSGAGGAVGAGGAPAVPEGPLNVRLSGLSADEMISGANLESLFDRLQDEAGDRGIRVAFA